jgi:hypothetical protein
MILQLSDHSNTLSTLLLPCTFAVVAVVAILLVYGFRKGDSLGNECDIQNLEFGFLSHQFKGHFLLLRNPDITAVLLISFSYYMD